MKFFKKSRKGFTLVELIVVIAIVAILAAVSVVSYIAFINKGNESADIQLVKQLNTCLKSDEALHGTRGRPAEMLEMMESNGFVVENMTKTKSGYDIVWGKESNRFALIDSEYKVFFGEDKFSITEENKGNTFFFVDTLQEYNARNAKGFAAYLTSEYVPTKDSFTTPNSIDCGDARIPEINYDNSAATQKHDVVIATNGGVLNVNAYVDPSNPKIGDRVDHYGNGTILNIQKMALGSYHEYGYFPKANIAEGRVVVEDKGNVETFEVTSNEPVQIETDKSVVVSVAETVTGNNVTVKVTNEEATVVVDEKINAENVDAKGKTEEDLVQITKVKNLAELLTAISEKKSYIMFTDNIHTNGTDLINIDYSAVLDGNGFKLDGNGGLRGSVKQMICIGYNASPRIEKVTIKNLTVETTTVTRPLECRGHTNEIVFDNVKLRASGPSNDQGFTYGGNENLVMKLTVKNCDLAIGGDGYTFIFFNPVNLNISNSTITGWAGLYFKSPSSSHGSRNSVVNVTDSSFICHNSNWGVTNSFGAIVFEDGNIDVTLNNTNLDVTENSDQEQDAILYSSTWAQYYGTIMLNNHVIIKGNSSINGKINCVNRYYDLSNTISIEGGTFTSDPTEYVAEGYVVVREGSLYKVM